MYGFPFYCHSSSTTREDPDFLHDTLLSCYPSGHLPRSPGRLHIWSFLDTMLSHPFISSSPFSSSCLCPPTFSFICRCSTPTPMDVLFPYLPCLSNYLDFGYLLLSTPKFLLVVWVLLPLAPPMTNGLGPSSFYIVLMFVPAWKCACCYTK